MGNISIQAGTRNSEAKREIQRHLFRRMYGYLQNSIFRIELDFYNFYCSCFYISIGTLLFKFHCIFILLCEFWILFPSSKYFNDCLHTCIFNTISYSPYMMAHHDSLIYFFAKLCVNITV